MIVGGALLLDRVANSHLHHLAALVSEQLSMLSCRVWADDANHS